MATVDTRTDSKQYVQERDDEDRAAQVDNAPDDEFAPLPAEAGFSINWNMVDGSGIPVQITMRGGRSGDWTAVMKDRWAFMEKAKAGGWTIPSRPQAAPAQVARAETSPAERAADLGQAAGPAPAPKPAAPQPAAANGILEVNAVKVDIEPQGDKAKVSFFEAGHKYADVYGVKPIIKWVELLGWASENFQQAASFTANVTVGYKLSQKLNSRGNPYKDIEYIKVH